MTSLGHVKKVKLDDPDSVDVSGLPNEVIGKVGSALGGLGVTPAQLISTIQVNPVSASAGRVFITNGLGGGSYQPIPIQQVLNLTTVAPTGAEYLTVADAVADGRTDIYVASSVTESADMIYSSGQHLRVLLGPNVIWDTANRFISGAWESVLIEGINKDKSMWRYGFSSPNNPISSSISRLRLGNLTIQNDSTVVGLGLDTSVCAGTSTIHEHQNVKFVSANGSNLLFAFAQPTSSARHTIENIEVICGFPSEYVVRLETANICRFDLLGGKAAFYRCNISQLFANEAQDGGLEIVDNKFSQCQFRLGITTSVTGFNHFFDCTAGDEDSPGSTATIASAGGKLVVVGCRTDDAIVPGTFDQLLANEVF